MHKQNNHTAPTGQINMVGDETIFEGTLRANSDVRISGQMIGTLEVSGRAIIAEGGLVEGEVIADSVDVAGTVNGELNVRDRLFLRSSARVEGSIVTEHIVVEEGAIFNGTCQMGQGESLDRSPVSSFEEEEKMEDEPDLYEEGEEEEPVY